MANRVLQVMLATYGDSDTDTSIDRPAPRRGPSDNILNIDLVYSLHLT